MIKEVLEYFGADVSRVRPGGWHAIKCPFHGDEHESASVLLTFDGGSFFCHGCGIRGGAIQLLMNQEDLTYDAAKQRAEEIAGGERTGVQPRSLQGNRLPGRTRSVGGVRKR